MATIGKPYTEAKNESPPSLYFDLFQREKTKENYRNQVGLVSFHKIEYTRTRNFRIVFFFLILSPILFFCGAKLVMIKLSDNLNERRKKKAAESTWNMINDRKTEQRYDETGTSRSNTNSAHCIQTAARQRDSITAAVDNQRI